MQHHQGLLPLITYSKLCFISNIANCLISLCFCLFDQEETKVVSVDGYQDVEESDTALLCAVAQQPVSVGIDGSAIDFQLYTGVSNGIFFLK